jgi:hypothetical protein
MPTPKAAKADKAAKPNPFEHIKNKRKHDVIGRKIKGEDKLLGRARKQAHENVWFLQLSIFIPFDELMDGYLLDLSHSHLNMNIFLPDNFDNFFKQFFLLFFYLHSASSHFCLS